MRVILFSGFLGSGKTTLILKLAQHLVSRGKKLAILVNEIGKIGIDNQMMKRLDLNVWELLAGCICCTLAVDLVATLKQLDEEHEVDIVIVEPSGAADPKNILNTLTYYDGTALEGVETISVLDPLRAEAMMKAVTPLITSQIKEADRILISRRDLASDDQLAYAQNLSRELNPEAGYLCIDKETESETIIKEIMPWILE